MNDIIFASEDSYHGGSESPFDQVKHMDEHGNEYWTGRDLQPLMEYPRWQDFIPVIDRARAAARNQGLIADEVFRVIPGNPSKQGGRPGSDIRMPRFGAYLVAMNGDPRKEAVAAAQAYFAVKTREAEIHQRAIPQSFAEALELAAAQQREIESRDAQLAIAAPKVALANQFLESVDTIYLTDLAKNLKITRHRLITVLRNEGVLFLDELNYRAGYEDWFEVVMDWIDRLGQYKPALKVTRLGVQKIYELLVDGEHINPDRRTPPDRPSDNRP